MSDGDIIGNIFGRMDKALDIQQKALSKTMLNLDVTFMVKGHLIKLNSNTPKALEVIEDIKKEALRVLKTDGGLTHG
jgi:hypothetical protein